MNDLAPAAAHVFRGCLPRTETFIYNQITTLQQK